MQTIAVCQLIVKSDSSQSATVCLDMKACTPQPGADAKHVGQASDTFFSSRLVTSAQTDAAACINLH